MAQLVINVENPSILPSLRKVLGAMEGVSILPKTRKKAKGTLDTALDDVKAGRVTKVGSVDDLMKFLEE